jgi:hypothetical protein
MKITKEYTLTEKEMKTIKTCLVYCLHRLKKHSDSGIQDCVSKDEVENLIVSVE